MRPLIRMTWVINRRMLLQLIPLFAFYIAQLVMAQRANLPVMFVFIFLAIGGVAMGAVMLQGLTFPVDGFLLSLPVSRAQVVRAKYATSLVALVGGLALAFGASWLAQVVAPAQFPAVPAMVLARAAMGALVLMTGLFCFLPSVFVLGPMKGLLGFTVVLILVPTVGLIWKGAAECLELLIGFGHRVLTQPLLALGLVTGVLLLGLASLWISVAGYQRRAL